MRNHKLVVRLRPSDLDFLLAYLKDPGRCDAENARVVMEKILVYRQKAEASRRPRIPWTRMKM